MDSIEEHIKKAVKEEMTLTPYNPEWPLIFKQEKIHLLSCLPQNLVKRVEHFGSTAIPSMTAKPIIDILVEVTSLEETQRVIVPILTTQGYEYFWRPSFGDDIPPWYTWFIRRDEHGLRTHHIHMVEKDFEHWDRLLFRDYLIEFPEIAHKYQALKLQLANDFFNNRVEYTKAKTEFILSITQASKIYYSRRPL